jgi:hypothetical protein
MTAGAGWSGPQDALASEDTARPGGRRRRRVASFTALGAEPPLSAGRIARESLRGKCARTPEGRRLDNLWHTSYTCSCDH